MSLLSRSTSIYYHTTNDTVNAVFEWTISDFILHCTGPELRPPIVKDLDENNRFSFEQQKKIWQIKLVPSTSTTVFQIPVVPPSIQENVNVSFEVRLVLLKAPTRWVTYKISMVNKKAINTQSMSVVREQSAIVRFPNSTFASSQTMYTSQPPNQPAADCQDIVLESVVAKLVTPLQDLEAGIVSIDKIREVLSQNGSLTVKCEIKSVHNDTGHGLPKVVVPKYDISSKLHLALQNQQFCDITLVSGTEKFKAHRVVLSVCSPVFATQIQTAADLHVPGSKFYLSDIQPGAVQEMLTYMYTGKAPNIKQGDIAKQLLCVSDKYKMDHLKALCEEELSQRLTVNNAGQLLNWASQYRGDQLKTVCLRFISLNWKDFVKTPGWQEMRRNTELAAQIIEVISNQQ